MHVARQHITQQHLNTSSYLKRKTNVLNIFYIYFSWNCSYCLHVSCRFSAQWFRLKGLSMAGQTGAIHLQHGDSG